MNILFDENIPYGKDAFSFLGEAKSIAGRNITADDLKNIDILFVRSVTKVNEKLLSGSSVKFVATATSGSDHIDKEFLQKNNIGFSDAIGSNANSVAEYFIAAILEIAEKNYIKLEGKSVGIIGVGHVGSLVEKKARAIGLTPILNDPPRARAERNFNNSSFEKALAADIITFHTPLTKNGLDPTFHLLDERALKKINPGAILVQASRGAVHDTPALKKAIKEKNLLCAIDVWENEPDIDIELLNLAQIATPHIAGYSWTSKVKATQIIYEAACDYFNIESEWQPPQLPKNLSAPEIDFNDFNQQKMSSVEDPANAGANDIKCAVDSVYDIISDDKKMRLIIDEPPVARAKYFDQMRKNYPIRVEFHQAKLKNTPKKIKQQLSTLSFKI